MNHALPVLISFGNLLREEEAFLFNPSCRLRTIVAAGLRNVFGENNTLFNHLGSVSPLLSLSVVGVRGPSLEDKPFAAVSGLGKLLLGFRVVCDSHPLNREEALFIHLDFSYYLTRFLTSYYRDLIREYKSALLDSRHQGEGELIAQGTDRTLNQQGVVFTLLASIRQIPSTFATLQLESR